MRFSLSIRLTDEEVWVADGKISYVGPHKDGSFDREVNLGGNILMPGFKNMHTHTAMVFLRSLADRKPLQQWLFEDVYPNEAKLTPDALYYMTKLGIMEYLSSGITSIFDMYFFNDAFFAALDDTGYTRSAVCSALNNFDKDITNIEREYCRFQGRYKLGIHAEYTTCMERMEYMVSLAEKYKAPCFTHLSETKAEVDGCIERYGKTPPQLLYDLGFFRYGGGGFHCCHMSEDDIRLFADNGLYAVTCPASNLKLSSGIAPVEKMSSAGVRVAIGTDGAASNNALDMFREMYLVSALQKYLTGEASACPAEDVLKMACVNGAEVIGLQDSTDIAEGMSADLVVIDLSQPNMQPVNNAVSNIVYSGSKSNVKMTVVAGKILYEDGQYFIGEDAETIYSKAQEFVDKL